MEPITALSPRTYTYTHRPRSSAGFLLSCLLAFACLLSCIVHAEARAAGGPFRIDLAKVNVARDTSEVAPANAAGKRVARVFGRASIFNLFSFPKGKVQAESVPQKATTTSSSSSSSKSSSRPATSSSKPASSSSRPVSSSSRPVSSSSLPASSSSVSSRVASSSASAGIVAAQAATPTSSAGVGARSSAAVISSSSASPTSRAAAVIFSSAPAQVSTKASSTTLNPGQASDKPSKIQEATAADVYRYRYHYGANLGSVWVIERWLFPGMFPNGTAANLTSELAAVEAWVQSVGLDSARKIFESHWADAVEDSELDFIASTGRANSVRIPLGFFTLGPQYCNGTPFEPVAGLYQNAWSFVKQAVAKVNTRGVGVLLDFHALPGGANTGDHSGTNSGEAQLWESTDYLALAQDALNFIVSEASSMPGVIGVQVVNEAIYDAPGMYAFYDKLLAGFVSIDNTIPIYISDGWDLPTAISYVKGKNKVGASYNPVVIDTHLYWAFTQADWNSSPQQIIAEVPGALDALKGQTGAVIPNGGVSVVVGEYSDVMDDKSWALRGSATVQDLTIQFGHVQNALQQANSSGAFFWSTKMDPTIHYGGWCFGVQTQIQAINPPSYQIIPSDQVTTLSHKALASANATMQASYNAHVGYWNQTAPQAYFEHWRFQAGWQVGFNDSRTFFGMRTTGQLGNTPGGGDKIGLLDLWVRKRITESGMQGNFVWEFEQGFRKGIADFGALTGAY